MKYSKQREMIRQAVMDRIGSHPSADDIYSVVRQQQPNISLGTVYRNLNLLSEHGVIHKIAMSNTGDRFDGRTDEHYHLYCEKCGKLFDAELTAFGPVGKTLMDQQGFAVHQIDLIVRGVCRECREAEQKNKEVC